MKFCKNCDNMLYINVNTEKNLVYFCKNCCLKDVLNTQNSQIIIDDNKIDDKAKYSHYMNKNLKYDNTLPRVNNIMCVNEECKRKDNEENEVIYVKYDPINMKYLYYCCYCEHFWRNE